MRAHRPVILAVLIALSFLLLVALLLGGLRQWNGQSAVALLVVVVAMVLAGVAFSWRRYFGGRRSS